MTLPRTLPCGEPTAVPKLEPESERLLGGDASSPRNFSENPGKAFGSIVGARLFDMDRPWTDNTLMAALSRLMGSASRFFDPPRLRSAAAAIPDGRAAHALKRLKDKDLWAGTVPGLIRKASEIGDAETVATVSLACAILFRGAAMIRPESVVLSDEDWIAAIDLAVCMASPETSRDTDRKYADIAAASLRAVYPLALALAHAGTARKRMESFEKQRQAVIDAKKYVPIVRDALAAHEALSAERDRLASRLEDVAAAFDARKRWYEARIARLEHDVAALSAGEAVDEAESDEAFAAQEAVESDEAFPETDGETDGGEADPDLPELPETKVLFIGGHSNMVGRLKKAHPLWYYRSGKEAGAPPESADVWFLHPRQLSHGESYRITKVLDGPRYGHVKLMVVDSTNMARLERDMRTCYARYLAERSGTAAGSVR